MPRVTGRDAIANLRSKGVRTPGLILTGSALLTREQLRGLVTLLRKPVSIDVLLAEIRCALEASLDLPGRGRERRLPFDRSGRLVNADRGWHSVLPLKHAAPGRDT
jgi:FixJ family two-component response regulator